MLSPACTDPAKERTSQGFNISSLETSPPNMHLLNRLFPCSFLLSRGGRSVTCSRSGFQLCWSKLRHSQNLFTIPEEQSHTPRNTTVSYYLFFFFLNKKYVWFKIQGKRRDFLLTKGTDHISLNHNNWMALLTRLCWFRRNSMGFLFVLLLFLYIPYSQSYDSNMYYSGSLRSWITVTPGSFIPVK